MSAESSLFGGDGLLTEQADTFEIGTKRFKLDKDAFSGSIDKGVLTLDGAQIGGWAVDNRSKLPAKQLAITIASQAKYFISPSVTRNDIASTLGHENRDSGFLHFVPIADIPPKFDLRVEVFAIDEDKLVATRLPKFRKSYFIDLPINGWVEFARFIQVPSTRISDPNTLVHAAAHILSRFPNDYVIRAGSLCVIGYRILDDVRVPADIEKLFYEHLRLLVESKPDISPGAFFRWHTSLRLVAGYVALKNKDIDDAIYHFQSIIEFSDQLDRWPSALTNLLLGVFFAGYLYLLKGDKDKAAKLWDSADATFKHGASIANFVNAYAYDELTNALNVVKECHVGKFFAQTGHAIDDPSLGPVGRMIEFDRIPGPFAKLVKALPERPA